MPESEDLEFGDEHPLNLQYTTKDARLLNQTESGITRAIAEESENFLERQYGRVFIVTDSPFTDDAYDVGEVISDTFQREFFGDLNRTVGESFEKALTALNQTLADLAAEGQSDWVGKLNAVIGVIHENELFVTAVGRAKAYLVRGHTSTDITEGMSEDSGQTAKTFQSVTEGALEVGDKVLVATPELLSRFPVRDLRRTVFLHSPVRAIQKLAEEIGDKRPERFAAIIVELTTVDLISSETLTDETNEIILAAPRKHFESLQKFQPFTKDTQAGEMADKAKRRWDREYKPKLKRFGADLKHRVTSLNAKRRGEAPPPPPPRAAAGTPETEPIRKQHASQAGTAASGVGDTVSRVSRQTADALKPAVTKTRELWRKSGIPNSGIWRRTRKTVDPLYRRLANLPWREQFAGDKRTLYRNLILGAALVLVISVAFSLNAAQTRKAEAKVRDRIQQIEELQAKAEASYIFKDTSGARKQLNDAVKQANVLAEDGVLEDQVNGLQRSLNVSYNRINAVVEVKEPIADFGEKADQPLNQLAESGTSLYAFGPQTPIYTFNLNGKQITAGNNSPTSSRVHGSATTSNGDVLLLTDKPSVVQLDTSSGVAAQVDLGAGGKWEQGVALDTVQQNAYILSPKDNQVWRHTRTLSAFNKGEPYFDQKVDLQNAKDLVTGASIYILNSNGQVRRAAGGQFQDFKLSAAPTPDSSFNGSVAVAVNFANDHIFVADPKHRRVVEFNNNGKYARQFRRDDFSKISDIVVDDKTERLYVLGSNKLWEIKL